MSNETTPQTTTDDTSSTKASRKNQPTIQDVMDAISGQTSLISEQGKRLANVETSLASGIDASSAFAAMDSLPREERLKLRNQMKRLEREGANPLQRAVNWLDDVTGGYGRPAAELGVAGAIGYQAGKYIYKSARIGFKFLTGGPAAAINELAE